VAQRAQGSGVDPFAVAVVGGGASFGLLWLAGVSAAVVSGHRVPRRAVGALVALTRPGDPSAAWRAPVGPPGVYWAVTITLLTLVGLLGVLAVRAVRGVGERQRQELARVAGLARRSEVIRAAGARALLRRRATLRPSLARAVPADLGYRLGRSRGVDCWASVEDSVIVRGPAGG
jgi:type IV secretion system protein VirD4